MSEINPEHEPELFPSEYIDVLPVGQWPLEQPVFVRPLPKRKLRLPVLLFIATCISTLMAGMEMERAYFDYWHVFVEGLMYAVPIMTILICHEMGHFLQARRHGVYCSYPYFIPMPLSPIGTMGAVIAMEPRMGHRRALFDIGITGPLAGLVPTMICCVLGIYWSHLIPVSMASSNGPLLGSPLIFDILTHAMGKGITTGYVLSIHPLAFAGWVGLLVTSLNLIPIGQLDGGHVLYALLGRKSHAIARFLLLAAMFSVVFYGLYAWLLMIFLLFMMGPAHPPTADDEEPLGWWRYVLGFLTLAFIPFGFTPIPFVMN